MNIITAMMCAGQLGRPKSESHGGQEAESRVVGLNNGTNNPFQDDRLPVWQSANSGNLSSPEVGQASLLLVLCSAPSVSQPVFTITEKPPTRDFSWLKAPTSAFTFKTLLRHYAKRALTPR